LRKNDRVPRSGITGAATSAEDGRRGRHPFQSAVAGAMTSPFGVARGCQPKRAATRPSPTPLPRVYRREAIEEGRMGYEEEKGS